MRRVLREVSRRMERHLGLTTLSDLEFVLVWFLQVKESIIKYNLLHEFLSQNFSGISCRVDSKRRADI